MLDSNREISTIVETSEFTVNDCAGLAGTSNWCLNNWNWLRLVEGEWLAADTATLLKSLFGILSNTHFSFVNLREALCLLAVEFLHGVL